jgi:hypothetical protein
MTEDALHVRSMRGWYMSSRALVELGHRPAVFQLLRDARHYLLDERTGMRVGGCA